MVENVTGIKSRITLTVDVTLKIKKKHYVSKKGYFQNPATRSFKNYKYARGIICNSVILQKETKTITAKSTSAKTVLAKYIATRSSSTNFYILLGFLLITKELLIDISIYLVKQQSKQKHLSPCHETRKLKETEIANIL